MRLSTIDGRSRTTHNFLDQIAQFHQQNGTNFNRHPIIDKKPVNLHSLHKIVQSHGGYDTICNNKGWSTIGRELGLSHKAATAFSNIVKQAYIKALLPYQQFIDIRNKEGKRISDLDFTSKPPPVSHAAGDKCEVCYSPHDDSSMLLCDTCNRGYHSYCLTPQLSAIPQCDWYCPSCLKRSGDDYGFEEGQFRNLEGFRQFAEDFKRKHFEARGIKGEVSEEACEKEFWRLVGNIAGEDVEVEYGADLHSSQHGRCVLMHQISCISGHRHQHLFCRSLAVASQHPNATLTLTTRHAHGISQISRIIPPVSFITSFLIFLA